MLRVSGPHPHLLKCARRGYAIQRSSSVPFQSCRVSVDLSTSVGALELPNPVLVASGTFGYAREMERIVDLRALGGIVPKTVTAQPRKGNHPWRTIETPSGLLNSIGLDNDGIAYFLETHLPYLRDTGAPLIVSVAGATIDEFARMAEELEKAGGVAAVELNISCPNVAHGVDFGTDARLCEQLVQAVRAATSIPLLAKLTPNVARISEVAGAAEAGGADGLTVINTLLGMSVNWRKRRPMLGNIMGGLSGPAIKPVALRCVYQVYQAVQIPIIGVGGIGTIDDVMEFLVTGAAAVQIGTANFYRPNVSMEILRALPSAVAELGAASVAEVVGALHKQ